MKTPWLNQNRILSGIRFGSGLTLISAATAMAFVAATNTMVTAGNGSSKSSARQPLIGKWTAQDVAGAFGEPGEGQRGDNVAPSDSEQDPFARATQDYLHRAYPAGEVSMKDTANAQRAWAKVKAKGKANGTNAGGNWTLIGPSNS